jgi:[acyl-carrier-protein] S-malonyltransferase
MNNKIAFIFPGQGAQKTKMGLDFFQNSPAARAVFEKADDVLGKNISTMIFEADEKELALTKNSQIAIYVTSMAILAAICERFPFLEPMMCAGLSLGEYTALTAAQMVSFPEMLQIVQARGNFMHEATLTHPGTMAAILGLELEKIEKVIIDLQQNGVAVWVANINCPGQIVISGDLEGVEKATQPLKDAGAKRVILLDVSGAFHSGLMNSAKERLAPYIEKMKILDEPFPVISNVTAMIPMTESDVRSCLIDQVVSPVRWEPSIRLLETFSPSLYLEIGPGKTLAGMNKKIGVQAMTISIEGWDDLDKLAYALEGLPCTC